MYKRRWNISPAIPNISARAFSFHPYILFNITPSNGTAETHICIHHLTTTPLGWNRMK